MDLVCQIVTHRTQSADSDGGVGLDLSKLLKGRLNRKRLYQSSQNKPSMA